LSPCCKLDICQQCPCADRDERAFWDALFTAMQDNKTVADEQDLEVTGISPHLEQQLSSIFVPPITMNVRLHTDLVPVWIQANTLTSVHSPCVCSSLSFVAPMPRADWAIWGSVCAVLTGFACGVLGRAWKLLCVNVQWSQASAGCTYDYGQGYPSATLHRSKRNSE
jgi:hypothetical protein